MKDEGKKGTRKRVYEAPKLRTIELAVEEVLALGCKLSQGGLGPTGDSCVAQPKCYKLGS